jgi:hypothetical protein
MRILFVLIVVPFWAWIAFVVTHALIEAWSDVRLGKKEVRRMREGAIERELEGMKEALAGLSSMDNKQSRPPISQVRPQ